MDWGEINQLRIKTCKTKELLIDLHRKTSPISPMNIQDLDIEQLDSYWYLGVHLNSKLDWSNNTEVLSWKGQKRLLILRRPKSFSVCRSLWITFYDFGSICRLLRCSLLEHKKLREGYEEAECAGQESLRSALYCPLDSI